MNWWNDPFFAVFSVLLILFVVVISIAIVVMYIAELNNIRDNEYIYRGYDFSTPESDECYGFLPSMNKKVDEEIH